MCSSIVDKTFNLSFLILLLCLCENVFPENPYKSGQVRIDYPKGCAYLKCKRGEQCINRRFWCKNRPCPSMLYCSKSEKESLKGPLSCGPVRCSKGYICLVRVRHCRWGEGCQQQIARCISERDYYEGPTSCVDFQCPSGLQCILRESFCAKPPCKLLKSCANTKDVKIWLEGCKSLGCLSEHECFLRRPEHNCSSSSCKHTPDCSAKSDEELELRELCRGWICPKGQECSAHTKGPCNLDSCRISRSCHKPLIIPFDESHLPQHTWRDDLKINFYSKQQKNLSNTEKNHFSSRSATKQNVRDNNAIMNKKNATNFADGNFNKNGKVSIDVSSNSRPSSSRSFSTGPDITSGRVEKPALVTSLTTWLNHLKLMTGIDAIQVWIKRADKHENYGEFLEWLDSVKVMLGNAAYDLWLEEVRAMTVTNMAFQKWLPSSQTNRKMDSHHLVETNEKSTDGSHEGLGISTGSQDSTKYPNKQEDPDDSQHEPIQETAGMRNDGLEQKDHIIWRKNDKTITNNPLITRENSFLDQSGIPPILPTAGMNEWTRLYPSYPQIFLQDYPLQQNFDYILRWGNQAIPYQGFDNIGLLNPPYQQFQSNQPFQQPPNNNNNFFPTSVWQNKLFSLPYPQWQMSKYPSDEIYPNRRILDSSQIPPEYLRHSREYPFKFYSQNSTNEDSSWINYFVNPHDILPLQARENFGSYPIDDRKFEYPSWPSFNYERRNIMPHRRSKHESSSRHPDMSHWNDRNEQKSGEKMPDSRKDSNFYDSGFPWNFMDPKIHNHHSHILDHNKKNLDDKNIISSSLTKNRRANSTDSPSLSLTNLYFPGNEHELYQPEYHWTKFYPRDRLYKILGVRSPSHSIQMDSLPKSKQVELNDEGTRKSYFDERVNDVPGQSMAIPDLWTSRYRNPFISILRKFTKEPITNRDTTFRNRPTSTTKSPPIVPSSRRIVASKGLPIPRENFHHDNDKYENRQERFDDYPLEEDDGIYPLLLSLQGYIESPLKEFFQHSTNLVKNSTILPVYTIDSDQHARIEDDYSDDYETPRENPAIIPPSNLQQQQGINFFQKKKYGAAPNFPDDLKNVIHVEDALIMHNQTSESDVSIKDVNWQYEDDENPKNEEDSQHYFQQSHKKKDGPTLNFSDDLKNVIDVEDALIMHNQTGDSDVSIKDAKWQYEDDENPKNEEDSQRFFQQSQFYIPSTDELSNDDSARGWFGNLSEMWNEGQTDYYDEQGVDYRDKAILADRSYSGLEQMTEDSSPSNEEIPEDLNDPFYDVSEHKRLKKNRP